MKVSTEKNIATQEIVLRFAISESEWYEALFKIPGLKQSIQLAEQHNTFDGELLLAVLSAILKYQNEKPASAYAKFAELSKAVPQASLSAKQANESISKLKQALFDANLAGDLMHLPMGEKVKIFKGSGGMNLHVKDKANLLGLKHSDNDKPTEGGPDINLDAWGL